MDCSDYLELISEGLDAPLTPARQAELEAHLGACPSCARLAQAMAQQSRALRDLDCSVPGGLRQEILAHLPPQRPARKVWMLHHPRRWAVLAACAALAVALGVAKPWRDSGEGAVPAPASAEGASPYRLIPDEHLFTANPRINLSPDLGQPSQAAPAADATLTIPRLPDGWEAAVDGALSHGTVLTGEQASALIALLKAQGIPYQLEGDETLSGSCQLILEGED